MVRRPRLLAASLLALSITLAGCGSQVSVPQPKADQIAAVGAENEYANVISQIGGRYVSVGAIESNPNVDPHDFEASPSVAAAVSRAQLVVQNGLGYDTYMNEIEAAAPSTTRKVVDVQKLLHLPDSTPNPHLWYAPSTMPAVAAALVHDLSQLKPSHAAYFAANARRFDASLDPWRAALARLATRYPGAPVATTEPVADDMLQAAGTHILTPFALQADIMNGVDPAAQDVAIENDLFSQHRVKAFVYNEQVTDSLTDSLRSAAEHAGIPVVAVYETMPTPGYRYQSWMLAETRGLLRAIADKRSTTRL